LFLVIVIIFDAFTQCFILSLHTVPAYLKNRYITEISKKWIKYCQYGTLHKTTLEGFLMSSVMEGLGGGNTSPPGGGGGGGALNSGSTDPYSLLPPPYSPPASSLSCPGPPYSSLA
jgi:hypothetical protein